MKCTRRALVSGLAAALSLASSVVSPTQASAEEPEIDAYAIVDGDKFSVDVGDVIYQATPHGDVCDIPGSITVGADAQGVDSAYVVGWTLDQQCQVIVDRIGTANAAEAGSRAARPTQATVQPGVYIGEVPGNLSLNPPLRTDCTPYLGWVKGVVLEQFGVTATERYTELRWLECGSPGNHSVQQPHASDGYCYHSGFPGWAPPERCTSSFYDQSPGLIWKEAFGRFEWYSPDCPYGVCEPTVEYTQYVAFDTGPILPPSYFQKDCTLRNGSLPYFWDLRCYGKRELLSTL